MNKSFKIKYFEKNIVRLKLVSIECSLDEDFKKKMEQFREKIIRYPEN